MTDFFQAEFVGTGNLTAYTPEIGAALTAPNAYSTFVGPPIDNTGIPNPRLTYLHRNTSGSWVAQDVPGWSNFNLYTSASPAGPDYYMETVLKLGGAYTDESLYHAHCIRGIRGTGGEADMFDSLGAIFQIIYSGGSWTVETFPDSSQDRAAAVTYVTWGTPTTDIGQTNVATGDIALRTEIEGFTIRMFVDSTLLYENTYSGTTYFNAAGKAMWQFYTDTSSHYPAETTMEFSAMRAGDAFLSPPPGDFWQDFVKTVEA